ncbi:LysR family transcriptional regulator [Allopusillimonas soli]|uniref:LysR family transcriptional regulator n=1 Tax=Allopusillimonas soli TaxID=659016 RepID=A0A853F5P2_9BURK|nr:LysR family transcriptional regulator [Allopusillimonas soli]NYT35845.1 LysR family transcriptional regulator [Allopusillimonas soli]TEA76214.1 LysR family transcriptional regulator [Allopusillimonas soli]
MKKYSLAQMEALLAISRLGSFHAAAKQINVTQPTISLRIRELEEALGSRFFERSGRNAKLSADGVVAAQYAEQAFDLFEEMEIRLRTGDPLQGTLRVGSSETVAISCLPQIISRLGDRFPNLHVELTVGNSYLLADALAANRLDVAFLSEAGAPPRIAHEPLALAPVAWVGSSHALLDTATLRPADLARTRVLCVPPPSPLYEIVAKWCAEEKSNRPTLNTCNSVAMIVRLVIEGMAMSVLPTCILRDEMHRGTVVRYRQQKDFEPLQICVAYAAHTSPDGLEALVNIARRVMQESNYFAPVGS